LVRAQRLRTPCAHRLGERTKRQRLGHVIVTPRPVSNASWQSRLHVAEPGPRTTASGFSAHHSSGPHAPSTNSTFWGSITDQLVKVESITEGPAPAFRPLPARGTLLRGQLTTSPVPGYWPRPSLDSAPRGALRPFLGHSAKMPRIRFYNRRFASRAPMSKHHFWRPCAERRGKPADVRPRDRPLERGPRGAVRIPEATPDHLAIIRPPTASRLTAQCRLRADWLPLPGFRAGLG
jgi:hypothetical protein